MTDFDETWARVCKVTGWTKFPELAAFLDIKTPSVYDAKKRGHMPLEWVFRVGQAYNISTDWLVTGRYQQAQPQDKEKGCLVAEGGPIYSYESGKHVKDPELKEIVDILEHDLPEAKTFILKVLRGRKEIKAGMAGLGLNLQNGEG